MTWYWLLLILVVVILVLWWALSRNAKATQAPTHEEETPKEKEIPAVMPSKEAVMEVPAQMADISPDDLEIIEGIGPKIAAVLKQAGISTFAQLAKEEPAHIKQILETAGLRLADPTSWPGQAKLAAEGDQAGLKVLQEQLKGGRVVH